MKIRGAIVLVATFWALSAWAFADQFDATNVRPREVLCFHKDGTPRECETVTVGVLAGGLTSMGSDADAAISPMARVLVSVPLASWDKAPVLLVQADLSALPGETVSLSDPATFKALEFRLGIAQRIHDTVNADLYAEAGFATRLPGEIEAQDTTARWAAAGVRIGRFGRGWLSLALGADQRMTGEYAPAVLLSGAVQLGERAGVGAYLTGDAVLGLDQYGVDRRDVVRIGICLGGQR